MSFTRSVQDMQMPFEAVYDLLHPDDQIVTWRDYSVVLKVPDRFNGSSKIAFRGFKTEPRKYSPTIPTSIDRVIIHVKAVANADPESYPVLKSKRRGIVWDMGITHYLSIPYIPGEAYTNTVRRAMVKMNSWFRSLFSFKSSRWFCAQTDESFWGQVMKQDSRSRFGMCGYTGSISSVINVGTNPDSLPDSAFGYSIYDKKNDRRDHFLSAYDYSAAVSNGYMVAFNGWIKVTADNTHLVVQNGALTETYTTEYTDIPVDAMYRNEDGMKNVASFAFSVDGPNGWLYALVSQDSRYLYLHWNDNNSEGNGTRGWCRFQAPSVSSARNQPFIFAFHVHYDGDEDKETITLCLLWCRSDNWWRKIGTYSFTTESGRFVNESTYSLTQLAMSNWIEKKNIDGKTPDDYWLRWRFYGGLTYGYELVDGKYFFHGAGYPDSWNFRRVASYPTNYSLQSFAVETNYLSTPGLKVVDTFQYSVMSEKWDFIGLEPIKTVDPCYYTDDGGFPPIFAHQTYDYSESGRCWTGLKSLNLEGMGFVTEAVADPGDITTEGEWQLMGAYRDGVTTYPTFTISTYPIAPDGLTSPEIADLMTNSYEFFNEEQTLTLNFRKEGSVDTLRLAIDFSVVRPDVEIRHTAPTINSQLLPFSVSLEEASNDWGIVESEIVGEMTEDEKLTLCSSSFNSFQGVIVNENDEITVEFKTMKGTNREFEISIRNNNGEMLKLSDLVAMCSSAKVFVRFS